jgi:N-acetylglucosamine-6-sulfatase
MKKIITALIFAFLLIFCAFLFSCGDDDDSGSGADDDTGSESNDDADDDSNEGPPNIVVILVDDMDLAHYNALLQGGYMPNLAQHIVDKGTVFTESYVSNPMCCPSRSIFLTGQYTHNNGVWNNNFPLGGVSNLDDSSTVATWLQSAGYRTCLIGKYLNEYGELTAEDYVPPGWDDWFAALRNTIYHVYNYTINDDGQVVEYGEQPRDYQTDVFTQRAVRFIDEAAAEKNHAPFFLWLNPLAPHVEFPEDGYEGLPSFSSFYELTIRPAPRHEGIFDQDLPDWPAFNEGDMSDKPWWMRIRPNLSETDLANARRQWNDQLASLLAVDDMIGAVVEALDRTGSMQNTVLMFSSDNGYLLGRHLVPGKTAPYEEAIRVPLIIHEPGQTAQRLCNRPVVNNDLAPTLADWAEAAPTHAVDGRSLLPVLDDPETDNWRTRFLIEHKSMSNTPFEIPDYLALRNFSRAPGEMNALFAQYYYQENPIQFEFYDMDSDPYQMQSLADDGSPERIAQREKLMEHLLGLSVCAGQECRRLEDRSGE